jgi:arsenite methyltransferase
LETSEQLKELVKEKYGQIADQDKNQNESSCCGATSGCSTLDHKLMADDYSTMKGYVADADLGLGVDFPRSSLLSKKKIPLLILGQVQVMMHLLRGRSPATKEK